MNGFVAFYRWILATKTAPKHGRAPARTNYAIGIPAALRCALTSGLSFCACRNTKIMALWILAEINLSRADFYRDTIIELIWSSEQKKSSYQILPGRRTNVKYFSTR